LYLKQHVKSSLVINDESNYCPVQLLQVELLKHQMLPDRDLDLSRSRDVISRVTVRFAIGDFSIFLYRCYKWL